MTVLSHLRNVATNGVFNGPEKASINLSVTTLERRLVSYFGASVSQKFRFGSSTRGTILPRNMDSNSDIDYMVVFSDSFFTPTTYLNRLKRFVEAYYSTSQVYQSSPTIVLELGHIKFDLVPALDGFFSYRIPAPVSNFTDWISTEPNDFNASLTRKNTENYSLIKPTIRLVKYWNSKNNYLFDSFLLEKKVVDMYFMFCYDQKDYFYKAINSLELGLFDAQWKHNRLNQAKRILAQAKSYEESNMPYNAEAEIKKLIPPI